MNNGLIILLYTMKLTYDPMIEDLPMST